MGRMGGIGRMGAPAATVSSRWGRGPTAAAAVGTPGWGPSASAKKMGRDEQIGSVNRKNR
jgi:hypothetical protein